MPLLQFNFSMGTNKVDLNLKTFFSLKISRIFIVNISSFVGFLEAATRIRVPGGSGGVH